MSWVAERIPTGTNSANASITGASLSIPRATPPSSATSRTWVIKIQRRFVPSRSTTGLHSTFSAHGSESTLVAVPIHSLSASSPLNSGTDTRFTRMYGRPSAKYRGGTHDHGDLKVGLGAVADR